MLLTGSGTAAVEAMLPQADAVRRSRVSAEHLTIGMQCGGSDGFSSITANPGLGAAMDILVRHGGTAVLSRKVSLVPSSATLK